MTLWSVLAPWCCALIGGFDGPVPIVIESDRQAALSQAEAVPQTVGNNRADQMAPAVQQRQTEVIEKLRVQRALRDAKAALQKQQFSETVALLEPFLDQADGSELVLEALEAGYRGQLRAFVENQDSEQARLIAEKLRALSPKSANDNDRTASSKFERAIAVGNRSTFAATNSESTAETPKAIPVAQAKPKYLARGKLDTESAPAPADVASPISNKCAGLLEQAERAFGEKDYREALAKFEQAYEADPVQSQTKRDHWGYCLMWSAVQRYNSYVEPAGQVIADDKWTAIEEDCRLARRLAPALEYTDTVLASVAKIRATQAEPATAVSRRTVEPDVASTTAKSGQPAADFASATESANPGRTTILRRSPASNGWEMAETENFRIFHRQPSDVDRIAKMAEQARLRAHDKWFSGEPLDPWQPKCDLTIYPSANEYQSATGVGIQSPGHSKTLNDRGRVTVRQLFIRSDDPNMMDAVLPHEVAHIVFAGKFGSHAVPRWADEGMAVLTEPMDKQEAHLHNLGDLVRNGQRFSCGQLLTAEQYPPGNQMRDFYAQSVGLCRHLVDQGGERKLVQLIRTALNTNNYDAALRQIYGNGGLAQLETEFERFSTNQSGWNNIASR